MQCPKCGEEEAAENAQFCGRCGARLGAATEVAAAPALGGPKTAPMTQMPELDEPSAVAPTDPMAGGPGAAPAAEPQRPHIPLGAPASTLPWRATSERKPGQPLVWMLALLACGSLGLMLFLGVNQGHLGRIWPALESAEPTAVDLAPPAPGTEASPAPAMPSTAEPIAPEASPEPPPAPERPAPPGPGGHTPPRPAAPQPSPAPTSPALPTPPAIPGPPNPTLPPPGPSVPPSIPAPPAPALPLPPPVLPTLPWGTATAGACERCLDILRGGGSYAVAMAVAQNLVCEDRQGRELCERQIAESAPALAEQAARAGDCPAAWASMAAALNLGVPSDRFRTVDTLCPH